MKKILAMILAAVFLLSGCATSKPPDIYFYEAPPSSSSSSDNSAPNGSEPITNPEDPPREITIPESLESYYEINSELIGWLRIAGLDTPVVQASDNDKYLTIRFDGTQAQYSETVFADFRYKPEDPSPQNILLYSHNLQSGNGFARIANYYPWLDSRSGSLDYYISNPTLEYTDLYDANPEPGTYAIFAAAYITVDESDKYYADFASYMSVSDKAEFVDYMIDILDRSAFYNPDIRLSYGDRIIALSTCLNLIGDKDNTRFVVFAKKIKDSDTVDTSNAYVNPDPLYFGKYYSVMGGKWSGRKWDPDMIGYTE